MTAKKTNAAKILTLGAKYVDKGWTKGANWKDGDGNSLSSHKGAVSMCAQGAVIAARFTLKLRERDQDKALQALRAAIPKRNSSNSVTGYNDSGRRTKAQVKTWFATAAAEA